MMGKTLLPFPSLRQMVHMLSAWACAAAVLSPVQATAQQGTPGVLVELYTSQGCSACPPADAMMHDLATRDDVIALALHVDYWDYIGWKDTFAHPAYTARQKAYAHAQGARHVYTPQMIIGGHDVIVGAKPMKLGEHLTAHLRNDAPLELSVRRDSDQLRVSAPTLAEGARGPLGVHVVRYMSKAKVDITRGENAGRTLQHANVVTDWQVVAEWSGREPLDMTVQLSGSEPVVVIVQEKGPRAVLAAVRVE